MKKITLASKFILASTSVALIACSPAMSHDPTGNGAYHKSVGKIQVTGAGEATQAPDQASVSAGVVTTGKTAGEAMKANATLMNAAFDALKRAGIEDRYITTSQMSLQPQYNYNNRKNDQPPRITGYQVRNTVAAKSDDMEKIGPMLDALVSAGVNNINGVNFSIKDPKTARAKARTDAIKDAQTKAEAMAAAAGVRLGKIINISESGSNQPRPQPVMMARAMDVSVQSTPVAAGEQTLSVRVSMTYAIDQ